MSAATRETDSLLRYNQQWNLGVGSSANRTTPPANNGSWPDLIKFNLAGTNLIARGQSNAVTLYYEWAKPATSNATVSLYVDDDFKHWNGNERLGHHAEQRRLRRGDSTGLRCSEMVAANRSAIAEGVCMALLAGQCELSVICASGKDDRHN